MANPDTYTLVKLHELIADPASKVLLLDSKNVSQGQRKWTAAQAVQSEQTYCVKVKRGYIAVDFDGTQGSKDADQFCEYLRGIGCHPVAVNSGGKNRAHVWCKMPEGLIDSAREKIATFKGDDRTGNRMRPPLSPHRTGAPVSLRGISVEDALEALGGAKQPIYAPLLKTLLETTDYEDRSSHVMRVVGHMKRGGYSESEVIEAVLAHPKGVGHKLYYPRLRRDASKYIAKAYQKANCSDQDREAVLPLLREIHAQALATVWPARNHALLVTLIVLIEIATRTGKLEITCSCRQLAEETGIGTMTAIRHIKKLIQHGWLTRTRNATISQGGQYRLTRPNEGETNGNGTYSNTPPLRGSIGMSHFGGIAVEAFAGRGSARNYFLFIVGFEGEFSTGDLARVSNRSYESARRQLRFFESLGLVKRTGSSWLPTVTADTLKEAADRRGKTGWIERTKRHHRLDRDNWTNLALQYGGRFVGVIHRAVSSLVRPRESKTGDSSPPRYSYAV